MIPILFYIFLLKFYFPLSGPNEQYRNLSIDSFSNEHFKNFKNQTLYGQIQFKSKKQNRNWMVKINEFFQYLTSKADNAQILDEIQNLTDK